MTKCLTCDLTPLRIRCGVCHRCYRLLEIGLRNGETVEQQVAEGRRLAAKVGAERRKQAITGLGKKL